jgi:hypothetical protein
MRVFVVEEEPDRLSVVAQSLREVILHGPFGAVVLVGKSMRSEEAALQQLRGKLPGAGTIFTVRLPLWRR